MPADIRSFFGGKPSAIPPTSPMPKPAATKKTRGKRKILEESDEDEDEPPPQKASPQKPPQKKQRSPTPEGEATTTSDYFGKSKPKKSAPVRASSTKTTSAKETPKTSPAKAKSTPKSAKSQPSAEPTPIGRTSARRKAAVNYNEEVQSKKIVDDDFDGGDDVFAEDFKNTTRGRGDDYVEEDNEQSDDDIKPKAAPKRSDKKNKSSSKQVADDDENDFVPQADVNQTGEPDDEDNEFETSRAHTQAASGRSGKKRKSIEIYEDEDEPTPKKAKSTKKSEPNKPTPKKAKKQDDIPQDSAEIRAIFDSIPLVRPPTPPNSTGEKKKFQFGQHANSGAPPAQGSKEVPVGAENCLAGLAFVFTGLLDSLSREDGQSLVKRYGGKVVGNPSNKTSYVVLGSDAGPKKLETIAKNNIKTINEDGLFELIRRMPANGGDSKAASTAAEKKKAEMEKIQKAAAEDAEEEKQVAAAAAAKSPKKQLSKSADTKASNAATAAAPDTRLWTVKYAPTQMSQICGNKAQVERLQKWLRAFPKNQRTGFKLPGADGMGTYRAVIIYGPPGIGKTTAAHLVSKIEGYDIVESNASDTRSKKLVETGLKGVLDTTSLLGYFAAEGEKVDASKKKLVLIMDEVDGMSAGDRGGVGALAQVCKKSTVPMILICNDRKLPKMKPFDFVTFGLQFRRPTVDQIRARIMTIGFRENMKMPANVVDALIEGSGADIRQIVNMVSTAKLDQNANDQSLDFDRSKEMSKAWQKHIILKPWDIVSKILGGGLFQSASTSTLNDKIELYFNDHEWSALMLQENYLGTSPILANQYQGRERNLKALELVDKAANSISEGDLVDRMIHGTQQHWSLMPTHAVFSFVRPASFIAGTMAGHQTRFTTWLGQNSSQGKLSRYVKEIQGHMRLRASGDRHEVRQQYIPALWTQLVKRLKDEGKDAVPEVINLMDSYFLTREDWDAIVELGVGPMKSDPDDADDPNKLASQVKATFTRLYNQQSHPLPYMKASSVTAPAKASKEKPDLEEAIDESDDAEVLDDDPKQEDQDDELGGDLSKDKYVKQPKKKRASTTGKGKKTEQNLDEEEGEGDTNPKKGKGKSKAGKGKGKA